MPASAARAVALVACLLTNVTSVAFAAPQAELVFERDVALIFGAKCGGCHGAKSRKAELDLITPAGVRRGGESGEIIVSGDPTNSLLVELLESGQMPPDDEPRLTADEFRTVARWIASGAHFADPSSAVQASVVTLDDVTPILFRRCTVCHGAGYQRGGLDARTRESLLRGGDSGPSVVVGDPAGSRLVQRVVRRQCPPADALGEAGIEPMTSEELNVLRTWIDEGAATTREEPDVATAEPDSLVTHQDRDFWAFQPLTRPRPPSLTVTERTRNPIDAFLLEKLQSTSLGFSPEADRETLARRVTFDLTGLPPSPEEVDRFLSDTRPDAYERLVDRLLASPRYGESWGRFWLDVAGYSDSEGKRQADLVRPYAYRYRDYVIQAFNADKPFDAFLVEQLAGDELVDYADADALTDDDIDKLVATGFLRMAPDGTSADPVNRVSDRVEVIADELDVLGRGVLGLTLKCARCHSHKYDPIPQRDYYRLVAVFRGAYDEYDWLTPQAFGNQWKDAGQRYLEVATPDQRRSVLEHNQPIQRSLDALRAARESTKDKAEIKKLDERIKQAESRLLEPPRIRALWDRGQPSPTYIYQRGDDTQPTRPVGPGVLSALTDGQTPFVVEPPRHSSPKTGRRLALARWLTTPDHPLTARVFVNRVWGRRFGRGIVSSVDNFGRQGEAPSHPELLDWLARDFVESGWSVKRLHRLMVTSTAYRQRSLVTEELKQRDPDNRWLSRMPMRRLSAEEVRDSMLYVAGRLSERPFGPPDTVEVRSDGLVTSQPDAFGYRRSVYVRQRRKEMPTLLETFDLPQMNPNCTTRRDSTVVSQPLFLLNNKLVRELSRDFANRVARGADSDTGRTESLRAAYRWTLGRRPTAEEMQVGAQTLDVLISQWQNHTASPATARSEALADVCHGLLNSAAFLYVD